MHLLHITDLQNGHIQVSWQRESGLYRPYPQPLALANPLTPHDQQELRWYLEEYLLFPYGAERERALQVEQKMAAWGEALFRQVFVKTEDDPDPRTFYQEAVREGLDRCELCISSEDAEFLNMPWELLRDPTPGRGYLAPSLAGMFRQRSGYKVEAPPPGEAGRPFRILLVIARPYGQRDVSLGTIARPMLQALRDLRPRVELELLRPPTFEALVERLNRERGAYDLVHFDGHGIFAPAAAGPVLQFGAQAGHGRLVFETAGGEARPVDSQELGQALATCQVPLFVLNACQSAVEGSQDPFASVAAQLLAVGARGVVAMSYSVWATTAALFMQHFYQRLVARDSLAQAVARARQMLYSQPERQSVVGPLHLRDWLVPVLYQQEAGYTPVADGPEPPGPAETPDETGLRRQVEQVCPEGRFGFIGRDYDLLRIERALRQAPWVLLSGLGGTGKTELAFGFARWFAETGGCPGGVFVTSFKEKADFGQVVGSIVGHATEFSRLPDEQQWAILVEHLRRNPCLLVWDNLETVTGYPAGSPGLASGEEQQQLARFVQALRGGHSRVVLTSRKPAEEWLGVGYSLLEIGGLGQADSAGLAEQVLRTAGRQPQEFRDDPDYSRLLRLLQGHPRSMEVVLPHLRRRSPGAIIEALQHHLDEPADLLDASLTYGFDQFSAAARRHLPLLGLFGAYVDAGTIANFVAAGDEQQAAYQAVVGEAPDAAGWRRVLEEAAAAGYIRPVGEQIYALHPTLPAFLRRRMAAAVGEAGLERLDGEFERYYAGLAGYLDERVRRGESDAVTMVMVEEANLLRALHLAERRRAWDPAQDIVQALGEFYEVRQRAGEWRALRSRLLERLGRALPAGATADQASLWMYLLGEEANDALARNDLAAAEQAYQHILDHLLARNDPAQEPKVAVVYHQLGLVAQARQQFERAEEWYTKALAIFERLGLERDAASDYHQLGNVAYLQQQFDRAEEWYKQALAIRERLGLERYQASDYHQLGIVAEERQQFERAEAWYKQALAIKERLGLERYAASDYHQLGNVAYLRQQFERAEAWYTKALAIFERLGLERDAATDYHQLGRVAQEQQQFERAEDWYKKALAIYERLGLERDAAGDYHQLGMVAGKRQQFERAEDWYTKALAIYERLGLERYAATVYHQLGIVAQRQQFEQAEDWYEKALAIKERLGHPPLQVDTLAQLGVFHRRQQHLEPAVTFFGRALAIAAAYDMRQAGPILRNLAQLLEIMGPETFAAAWQQALPGQPPPLDALRQVLDDSQD